MAFKKVDPKQNFSDKEKEVLKFWEENKIFEKSIENRADSPVYNFYDGPPFATGTPHYGHIVSSVMKDVVPRYWTMRGYYVERRWGWDCHGLPIENIVEKEMGSQAKKDIEKIGVDKFNELCRSKVLDYVNEWKKVIRRLGRWVDMENAYQTMNRDYMESVWWVFKELYDKGLVYKSYRIMHICPRCETTLSQSEVAEGYKDVKDLSATVKFKLINEPKTFVLAWTTTPWTLIANAALAVNEKIIYGKFKILGSQSEKNLKLEPDELYIVSKDRAKEVFRDYKYEIIEEFKGEELVGKKYQPVFEHYYKDKNLKNREKGWMIYSADFVTAEEGTGVVHIAPAFGEDDMKLGKEKRLPFIQHVGMDGVIDKAIEIVGGLNVKPARNLQATDVEIIKYLAKNNLLFAKEKFEHSYPHCWRCDTPLINYATSSWFVAVEKIKSEALKTAKEINWSPEHIKKGRFGKWLEGARDWSISRQRFWASVIPIWVCDKCAEKRVIGSVEELESLSGKKINDLHKHIVDEITFKCEKCGGTMRRVPDVLDTWFDSGSMPYAQAHYPFENKEKFEKSFPAEFIAEGVDQTRAWFYYLHIIATALKEKPAFKNVIVNGIVLAEDGKKMSKRLKNYPDPMEMFEKYGADAVRYYLMSSPVVVAENLNFSEKEVAEVARGMMRMLWNSYSFFVLYANIDKFKAYDLRFEIKPKILLDRWIISELHTLIKEFNQHMENYELQKAARLLPKFTDNLSNWYIRRSRKRFWKSENDDDKNEAYATLYYVLVEFSKVLAPFMPFMAEEIYGNLVYRSQSISNEIKSVHLENFPAAEEKLIDKKLNEQMRKIREIITEGLQLRARARIKVRQPLSALKLEISNDKLQKEFIDIIKEEVNVKKIEFAEGIEGIERKIVVSEDGKIGLEIEISEELKLEGQAREIIRFIQEMRKKAGYEVDNKIKIWFDGVSDVWEKFGNQIAKETLADSISSRLSSDNSDYDLEKEFEIDKEKVKIWIKRIKK